MYLGTSIYVYIAYIRTNLWALIDKLVLFLLYYLLNNPVICCLNMYFYRQFVRNKLTVTFNCKYINCEYFVT